MIVFLTVMYRGTARYDIVHPDHADPLDNNDSPCRAVTADVISSEAAAFPSEVDITYT